jgi:predicted TIM-barrel fold metal-dependent hydrolase
MSEFLSEKELQRLDPAEICAFESPVPTQPISNGEFFPGHQSREQKQVEDLIREYGESIANRIGMGRRQFLKTAAGMAVAFLAMNEVYGAVFDVSSVEAGNPEMAAERAQKYSQEFICDLHTHFLRDDTRLILFVKLREFTGRAGFNPELTKERQTLEHLKFGNYVKEMFLDSDTKVALLSGAPSDIPTDWFLTNEMKADARRKLNAFAGSRRLLTHAVFAPGQKGWLEDIDRAIELKPEGWKGYTIGDNTNPTISKYPWRMDDEKLVYPAYEKFVKSGIRNVAVHKGLYPPGMEAEVPNLKQYAKVDDVGKAAKDWPQLNFFVYHAGYRYAGGPPMQGAPDVGAAQFENTGRIDWVSDLMEIPQKYGVSNVYADVGAVFANCCISYPRLAAAMMGMLVKGLGTDHVVWGTDSLWFGSPQWQIEALRRLEIPEDMQKKYGYAPLGPPEGETKRAIFGLNSARLFGLETGATSAWKTDPMSERRTAYLSSGPERSNLAYGWVRKIDSEGIPFQMEDNPARV